MDYSKIINKALDYIENNLTNDLDIKEIADYCSISKNHFQKLFKNSVGFTVHDYITKRKLAKASDDLINGTESISDISYKYGYNSPDTFTRAFKRENKITPCIFRKEGKIRNHLPKLAPSDSEGFSFSNETKILEIKVVEKEGFAVIGIIDDDEFLNEDYIFKRLYSAININTELDSITSISGIDLKGKYKIEFPRNKDGRYKQLTGNIYNPLEEYIDEFKKIDIPKSEWFVIKAYNPIGCNMAKNDIVESIFPDWLKNNKTYKSDNPIKIIFDNSYKQVDKYLFGELDGFYCEMWIQLERS